MQGPSNKETFKLLQISDDSKSLSDLELPEILNQRKRKVRRKTRPRPNVHRQDVSNTNQCNRLIVWVAIFLTCCWLLTLSYMIAVIHSENLRLEVQIKKLSVTSQNLPEALQKWHETSKNLEQNQTIIYGKISELQHSLEKLSADFSHYKDKLKEKQDYSKDEKLVSDLGAKIVAVSTDVDTIKERFGEFQKYQAAFRQELLALEGNFSQVITKASAISNNKTTNCSEEISNLKAITLDQIKSLTSNLSIVNDTLSQKAKILTEDVIRHKKLLDDLSEIYANTTSHVTSIEDDWMKYKTKVTQCEQYKNEIDNEIARVNNFTAYLNSAVEDTRSKCDKYHTEMAHFINQIKNNKTTSVTEIAMSNEGSTISANFTIPQKKIDTVQDDIKTTPKMDSKLVNISEPPHMRK